MEVIIAILWYLQLLFTGANYTTAQVDELIISNQETINQVQSNEQLVNTVMQSYTEETTIYKENNVVEVWDEEPEPIPD